MKNNKHFSILVLIALVFVACCFTGTAYGLWQINAVQTETNVMSVGCFDVDFTEKSTPINLTNTYPVSDEKGLETNPYIIEVQNVCSISAVYYITFDIIDASTDMDLSKVKVAINGEISILGSLTTVVKNESGIRTSYLLKNDAISNTEAKEYNIKVWIDASAGNTVMGRTLEARLTIMAVATN